jgi:glucokinase
MDILAGDIGGTNTRLALADSARPGHLGPVRHYQNVDAACLEDLIADFLQSTGTQPTKACIAVAGPTDGKHVDLTNLAWRIDADLIARRFGVSARLINDFAAVGHGLEAMAPGDLHTLQVGVPVAGAPRVVLGAGTGLGVTQCMAGTEGYRPWSSEGGHIAFAPVDEEQCALWRGLQIEHGRVSVERILSGPGIVALYRHCRQAMGRPMVQARAPADITHAALAGDDATAVWAMRLFRAIYGQAAGDYALMAGALGGVYLAGGIAAKILPLLDDGVFMAGFRAKGRFSDWMGRVPVQVVLDPDIGLKGAALAAGRA